MRTLIYSKKYISIYFNPILAYFLVVRDRILKSWLYKKDWNKSIQEFCALLIGIGLGLYAYESKAALVPMKWQMDREVAGEISQSSSPKEKPGFFGRILNEVPAVKNFWAKTGVDRYVSHLDKYTRVMDRQGVKGANKKNLDSLMRKGVEPVPQRWNTPEAKPYFILGVAIVVCCFLLKILIYMAIMDFERLKNRLYGKLKRKASAKAVKRVDWNGILHEITTLLLSVIGGMLILSSVEDFLKGEEVSIPYPLFCVITVFVCLLIKAALYSSFFDINEWRQSKRGRLFSRVRFRRFSKHYDWNELAQGFTALVLGLGLGIYAYDSNLALLPMKWQMDREVASEVAKESKPKKENSGWGIGELLGDNETVDKYWKVTGANRYVNNIKRYTKAFDKLGIRGELKQKMDRLMRSGVEPVPEKWKDPANRPYLVAFLILFLFCLILKIAIYLSFVDMNRFVKGKAMAHNPSQWNDMIQEMAGIVMSTFIGVYMEPGMDYVLGGDKEVGFPYPVAGPITIGVCIFIIVLFRYRWIDLDKRLSRSPKKGKKQKSRPVQRRGKTTKAKTTIKGRRK